MPIVRKVQKSLADLEMLHSAGSAANLFIPAAVGPNSQNKVKNIYCQEKILFNYMKSHQSGGVLGLDPYVIHLHPKRKYITEGHT